MRYTTFQSHGHAIRIHWVIAKSVSAILSNSYYATMLQITIYPETIPAELLSLGLGSYGCVWRGLEKKLFCLNVDTRSIWPRLRYASRILRNMEHDGSLNNGCVLTGAGWLYPFFMTLHGVRFSQLVIWYCVPRWKRALKATFVLTMVTSGLLMAWRQVSCHVY